jgi:hypothetical protein
MKLFFQPEMWMYQVFLIRSAQGWKQHNIRVCPTSSEKQ